MFIYLKLEKASFSFTTMLIVLPKFQIGKCGLMVIFGPDAGTVSRQAKYPDEFNISEELTKRILKLSCEQGIYLNYVEKNHMKQMVLHCPLLSITTLACFPALPF